MILHVVKWFFVLVFTSFLLLGVAYCALNASGFCISRGRFLSEGERIEMAVNYLNSQSNIAVNENGIIKNYAVVKYDNNHDILEKNKNCCEIGTNLNFGDSIPSPSIFYKIVGQYRNDVTIEYAVRYKDDMDNKTRSLRRKWLFRQENCGRVWF